MLVCLERSGRRDIYCRINGRPPSVLRVFGAIWRHTSIGASSDYGAFDGYEYVCGDNIKPRAVKLAKPRRGDR